MGAHESVGRALWLGLLLGVACAPKEYSSCAFPEVLDRIAIPKGSIACVETLQQRLVDAGFDTQETSGDSSRVWIFQKKGAVSGRTFVQLRWELTGALEIFVLDNANLIKQKTELQLQSQEIVTMVRAIAHEPACSTP